MCLQGCNNWQTWIATVLNYLIALSLCHNLHTLFFCTSVPARGTTSSYVPNEFATIWGQYAVYHHPAQQLCQHSLECVRVWGTCMMSLAPFVWVWGDVDDRCATICQSVRALSGGVHGRCTTVHGSMWQMHQHPWEYMMSLGGMYKSVGGMYHDSTTICESMSALSGGVYDRCATICKIVWCVWHRLWECIGVHNECGAICESVPVSDTMHESTGECGMSLGPFTGVCDGCATICKGLLVSGGVHDECGMWWPHPLLQLSSQCSQAVPELVLYKLNHLSMCSVIYHPQCLQLSSLHLLLT